MLFIRYLTAAGLVDTETLIKGLRSGVIRQAGLDVYENEAPYFFKDCSDTPVQVRARHLDYRWTHIGKKNLQPLLYKRVGKVRVAARYGGTPEFQACGPPSG